MSSAPAPRVLATLLDLHRSLCAGALGDAVHGLMAACFIASAVSGIVIYGPFMRQLDFGTVRNRSPRLKWLDLHNLVGIATATWALVVGVTGLMNTLETRLFAAWQKPGATGAARDDAGQPAGTERASLDAALRERARRVCLK